MEISKTLFIYSFCLFYSVLVSAGLVLLFITNFYKKFWIIKERPIPPKCLQNPEFGEHKYITANGIKFHYVEKGDPSKPLILFVHGFPEFWYSWRHQLKEFSNDYWCVAIDMRGYGDSDKPAHKSSYTINLLTDDIKAIVDALGKKKFILIAHDWGAVVAWNFVSEYMETLEKYICIGPPSRAVRTLMFSRLEQFLKSWYIFFFQMPCLPEFCIGLFDFAIFKQLNEGKFSKSFTEEDLEAFKYTFSKPGALTSPVNYYRNMTAPKQRSKLKQIAEYAPGLFLLGANDRFLSHETGVLAKKYMQNVEFKLIPGAHHFAQQGSPEETNRMISEFLKK